MSHTYAKLAVSRAAFNEIRERLEEAGYFFDEDELDMHGIALVIKEDNDAA